MRTQDRSGHRTIDSSGRRNPPLNRREILAPPPRPLTRTRTSARRRTASAASCCRCRRRLVAQSGTAQRLASLPATQAAVRRPSVTAATAVGRAVTAVRLEPAKGASLGYRMLRWSMLRWRMHTRQTWHRVGAPRCYTTNQAYWIREPRASLSTWRSIMYPFVASDGALPIVMRSSGIPPSHHACLSGAAAPQRRIKLTQLLQGARLTCSLTRTTGRW